ncbi:hypothetical protein BIW11_02663 [Tropilaelaps mercedesae]|uniref:Uncharacterized protein n=1 Tax=Tropilaelaps mercedesae TaxID=418985 RepID=A0A1V9XZD5_9ACAR|nr:hypothetical protein BIW11_02663 [Tropilaelaps mercedesae]
MRSSLQNGLRKCSDSPKKARSSTARNADPTTSNAKMKRAIYAVLLVPKQVGCHD